MGLYRVAFPEDLPRGRIAVARVPAPIRALAVRRGYLPPGIPLVKTVAAAGGAIVCASGSQVTIDGRVAATRAAHDPRGRPMPWWTGCGRLAAGDLFLLSDRSDAFDGRYFGVTRRRDVIGRGILLWSR